MNYVMSDIHGRYDKYIEMIRKINFCNDDTLYIIGDICDRGPSSAQIYLDVMNRKNVHCIMGNHEKMLIEALPNPFGFLLNKHDHFASLDFDIWSACGGGSTCASFIEVGMDKLMAIYNYILSLPLYKTVEIDKKTFLLLHAGIDNYDCKKQLCSYSSDELLWGEIDFDNTYYPEYFDKIIVGHTPTFIFNNSEPVSIYMGKGNVIDIDCGAVFEKESNGRFGCLCLETMEEYYV